MKDDDRLDPARGIIYAVRLAFWFWVGVGAVVAMMYSCSAKADDWDTTDKVLYGSFIAMDIVDIAQTRKIHQEYPRYYEENGTFGRDPNMTRVVAWKTFDIAAIGIAANYLPSPLRKGLLAGANVLQFSIIHHNYSVGLGWGF